MSVEAGDGVKLHADVWAPHAPRPVVCLPGLTRNARDFTALAGALARDDGLGAGSRVVCLESRGRGRSGRADPATYTLAQELDDLVAAMDALGIESARFVGTSRGGLLAMALADVAPQRVERVVLNDIGPFVDARGLERIAASVGAQMDYPSLDTLADALRRSLGPQFPRLDMSGWKRLSAQLASPRSDGAEGVRLDYDPALSEAFASFVSGTPADVWPAFAALTRVPLMVLRGANSDILSAATVEAMRRRHRTMRALVVPGEGHAPLLWDRSSQDAIKAFLLA